MRSKSLKVLRFFHQRGLMGERRARVMTWRRRRYFLARRNWTARVRVEEDGSGARYYCSPSERVDWFAPGLGVLFTDPAILDILLPNQYPLAFGRFWTSGHSSFSFSFFFFSFFFFLRFRGLVLGSRQLQPREMPFISKGWQVDGTW